MADTTGKCEGCGRKRVLQAWSINQMATKMLCAGCIADDHDKRSEAATGKAGPKPKRESQLELTCWKCYLTEAQSKRAEVELAKLGFTGGRNVALKRWLKSL